MKIVGYSLLFGLFMGLVTLCFIHVVTPTHRQTHPSEIIIIPMERPTEGFMHLIYMMTPEEAAACKAPKIFHI